MLRADDIKTTSFKEMSTPDQIDVLMMQRLTALKAGSVGDNPKVAEEAKLRLEKLGAKPRQILDRLNYIRKSYGTFVENTKTGKDEFVSHYEPVVDREIKRYEEMIA